MFDDKQLLSEHLDALTNAIRRELWDVDNESQNQDTEMQDTEECAAGDIQGISLDTLRREHHEVMTVVYSFLPLRDRIYTLSLVDREFSRDLIRGGILCANYGPGFNLKQALLELEHRCIRADKSKLPLSAQDVRATVGRMLKAARLADGEDLLYTGSNLVNAMVKPADRKRWVTSYVNEFICREKERSQKQTRNHRYTWLEETVLVQTFLKRYFFHADFAHLSQLLRDEDARGYWLFRAYNVYQCNYSQNEYDKDQSLVWCAPTLSPGYTMQLLDPDNEEGWKEHRFVTCALCTKLFRDSNNGIVVKTGQLYHVCNNCNRKHRTRLSGDDSGEKIKALRSEAIYAAINNSHTIY